MKKLLHWVKNSILLFLSGVWFYYGLSALTQNHLIDFIAFYGAAKNILVGLTPYGFYPTLDGSSSFQSPLWVGWLFVPLTVLTINRAFVVFGLFNLGISLLCLIIVLRWHGVRRPPLAFFYLLGCTFVLSSDTIRFGQVTLIQLAAVIVMISALHAQRPYVAGLALPLVIIKPHLVIFFLIAAFRRGGRKMLVAGMGSTLLLILIAVLTQPSWLTDMLRLVVYGQQTSPMEWNKFVTLTGLFSFPPRLGLVLWLLFLPILILLDNRLQSVQVIIWLPITLVLSLATAPYAFSYDLPLLIPGLVWLCLPWSGRSIILIFFVASIAIIAGFSGIAYIGVIAIAIFSVRKVMSQTHLQVDESISP